MIGRDCADRLDGRRVRNLGPIELDERILAELGDHFGKVVAAQVDNIVIGVLLAGLCRGGQRIRQCLRACTGQHELQLNLILIGIFGIGVEIIGQGLKDRTDVVRTGCPQGQLGLAALSAALRAAVSAAGQHGCQHRAA